MLESGKSADDTQACTTSFSPCTRAEPVDSLEVLFRLGRAAGWR